jgi:hypothetical protein
MKENTKVSKKEIIDQKLKYRSGPITLIYSKHAEERLKERFEGKFIVYPKMVQILPGMILSGTSDGKNVVEIKLKLKYSKGKYLHLIMFPKSGLVKTIYINNPKANNEYAKKKASEKSSIKSQEECNKEESKDKGGEGTTDREHSKDVGIYELLMVKITRIEKMLVLLMQNLRRK